MEYTPPLQYLIRQSLKRYVSLNVVTIGLVILVRFYEILFISGKAGYPSGSTLDLLFGIRFDLMLALRLSVYLLIPFLMIDHFQQKVARVLYASIIVAVVSLDFALLKYFSTTRIPLGSDILGYSMDEIQQTIRASGEMNQYALLPFLLFFLFCIYAFYKWSKIKAPSSVIILIISAMIFTLLPFNTINPNPTEFKNEFRKNISANKFNLFSESLINYYRQKDIPAQFELNTSADVAADIQPDGVRLSNLNKNLIADGGKSTSTPNNSNPPDSTLLKAQAQTPGNPFIFLSKDYPFLHKERTPNLLDPFFKPETKSPSIVFIIVESLGRAYTGQDAYLGSFTPFLDSLMSKSLYWENCLSTSGRTFSVIPSLLGSLPFGDKGFADLGDQMPDHLSLVNLLKNRAGYSSSFYYGGDPKFDDMEFFMRRQGAAKIVGINDFGTGYKQLPASSKGFSWGYGDREIFRKYITDLKSGETEKRVDVLLTIAMHNPFRIPDQAHYNELFEQRMSKINLSETAKKYNRQYPDQFATILYFDDALRYFFQEFSKLKSFENTIFVITGDHRMPEIPISTQIDRFHVPLVIYSPLLTKNQKFSSVVTHYDVTPSLLSLLKNRMNLSLPTVTSWIGHGLDTNISFRNLNAYPLKRNTGELVDYISGTHFVSGTTLYQIYPDLNIEPENDAGLLEQLQRDFTNYKAKNNFATHGNKVIPDSLRRYIRP
jgi:uncharacterized sulfatase